MAEEAFILPVKFEASIEWFWFFFKEGETQLFLMSNLGFTYLLTSMFLKIQNQTLEVLNTEISSSSSNMQLLQIKQPPLTSRGQHETHFILNKWQTHDMNTATGRRWGKFMISLGSRPRPWSTVQEKHRREDLSIRTMGRNRPRDGWPHLIGLLLLSAWILRMAGSMT